MANPLTPSVITGSLGELFAQMKLLELGVQAVAPHKDSGNDLIAVKGRVVKFIQVKTGINRQPSAVNLPEIYDLVFLVNICVRDLNYFHDESTITVLDNLGVSLGVLNCELANSVWTD